MVNMRVGEDDRVNIFGIKGETTVAFVEISPASLEYSAFKQQLLSIYFDEVL
jgi:hypothetical protein